MVLDPRKFKQASHSALADPELRKNFDEGTQRLQVKRRDAFAAIEEVRALQGIGSAVRNDALARLPELLERFEEKFTERGGVVHWAETTEEANRIVVEIAQRRGVKLAIKGKSMVSEEMGLNDYLDSHGIEAVEADLGEFIIQLAGQHPAHLVVPAIHMNRYQIAKLFHEELGEPYTVDIDEMTALARRVLRDKFQAAGMGITGVNFAVAETGTLALIENEGNGRMVSTVPPVHVALMGLEKVIANLSDLPSLQRLLTRSATGQAISTYFNWLSGPRRPGEKDGPEELHLVILDNGRSRIHADGQLRETLACIRCAACLNHCPVYSRIGGNSYGSVYMGPIGEILTPQMAGLEEAGNLAGGSTLCGACYEVCPVEIPIPDLLLRLRQESHQPSSIGKARVKGAGGQRKMGEAMVWKGWRILHDRPAAYRAMTQLARLAARVVPENMAPKNVGPLKGWSRHRALPRPAKQSLHQLLADRSRE